MNKITRYFLIGFFLFPAGILAQELNSAEKQIFQAEAVKFIEAYFETLPQALGKLKDSVDVNRVDEEGEDVKQKATFKQAFIEQYFDNNDVFVYNDLSPDEKEERGSQRVMTIDAYLDELKRLYGESKESIQRFSTSLKSSNVENVGYNKEAVEKFYYAKIKVTREMKGMYLGSYYTENIKELDFYIKTLDKPDTRFKKFSIINTDYESKEITVGNIGLEAAMAQGLRYFDQGDFDKAFPYLLKYSDEKKFKKNSNATWALGYMYFWGRGTERSDKDMVEWLTYSADRNNLYALYYLGENYWFGEYGVEEDEKKAFKLIKESARKGFAEGQFFMAERFAKGEGIRQSDRAAKRWYKRADKQGHPKASYQLKQLENK